MYYMNHDAVDCFTADFTAKDSIVGGRHYPLGYFAAEALERVRSHTGDIRRRTAQFKEDFQVFLAARETSSAAVAHHSLRVLWLELEKLPVYDLLLTGDRRAQALIPYLRRHSEETDDMLTPGTQRNAAYEKWIAKLDGLAAELDDFVRNTEWMLEEYFDKLRRRRVEHYARAFGDYRHDVDTAIQCAEESGEEDLTVDLSSLQFNYPVNISFVPSMDPETRKLTLAEQITFESLGSFLYMDLYKGMAAGNLPRRCQRCRKWFLAVGGYNTVYCDRVVPGTDRKTCRDVGAHEKEKAENQKAARKEYYRVYNRLKARKQRGKITTDEWNRQVVRAQELREKFEKRKLGEKEYVQMLNDL